MTDTPAILNRHTESGINRVAAYQGAALRGQGIQSPGIDLLTWPIERLILLSWPSCRSSSSRSLDGWLSTFPWLETLTARLGGHVCVGDGYSHPGQLSVVFVFRPHPGTSV